MKKALYIFSIALLSLSCNHDEVKPAPNPNDALLTRISRNGMTNIELHYDLDRNFFRLDYYYLGKLAIYHIYEYDGDILKESRRYNAEDHSLEYRSDYTADNFGRIVKSENYNSSDLNELATINIFEYTSSGQLKSREVKYVSGNSFVDEFNYDNQNNLTSVKRIMHNDEGSYTSFEITYTPGQQSIPPEWQKYILILELSSSYENVMHMFNSVTRIKVYSVNHALIGDQEYRTSAHLFNDEGNLIQVTITDKNILNPQVPDEIYDLNYDFQ